MKNKRAIHNVLIIGTVALAVAGVLAAKHTGRAQEEASVVAPSSSDGRGPMPFHSPSWRAPPCERFATKRARAHSSTSGMVTCAFV